ncbi:MAG TPA: hypothetical protein VGC87_06340 [Pyrinomonadaceae bacterium]|jgi:hypothetical protein
MRRELIATALAERLGELRGGISARLAPEKFREDEGFVSEVRALLLNASAADLNDSVPEVSAPGAWTEADTDCLASLRALSLGQTLRLRPGRPAPVDSFLEALTISRGDPAERFRLLAERYSCPPNFTLPSEDAVREHVLTRLMAQDRARVERETIEAVNADDLLLRLSLVALYAARASDLRFLDALNYYYELLPAGWQPRGSNNWLLASYFALYARALAARIG